MDMIPNYYGYPQQYSQYQQIPMPPQPQIQQPQIPQTQNLVLAWIKDEQEGIDYPLSAGQSIFLITQDEKYLYGKSCDQLGKVTMIKKRLVDETNQEQKPDLTDYIRREEIEDLITDRIQREVEKKMSEISFKPTKARKPVIIDEE